jgi:glycogen debranching enzyme
MLLTQPNTFTVNNRTIKNNRLFLVDDMGGEIPHGNEAGLGFYQMDTRHLSCLEIRLNDTTPVCLLSSTESGYMSTLVYTNGQMTAKDLKGECCPLLEETIELKRQTIVNELLFDRYTLTSYNIEPVSLSISIRLDVDFLDIFEIRHLVPVKIRQLALPSVIEDDNETILAFSYPQQGAETRIYLKGLKPVIRDKHVIVTAEVLLCPLESKTFELVVDAYNPFMHWPEVENPTHCFEQACHRTQTVDTQWIEESTEVSSDNEEFNEMVSRSSKDLRMLLTQAPQGRFVAAGIPWFAALFGRDSLITARESLLFNPAIARWTLQILAHYQGKQQDPDRDEEPGKILHEIRVGELAASQEIPHTPYYGSVDSTPLWLILLYDYIQWTEDRELLQQLWPHALRAMAWIDTHLAQNQWGYVTYHTRTPKGIVHQGWKDSHNSAMYANGLQAEPPIALVEVQGYVYHAKRTMAALCDLMGEKDLKIRLKSDNVTLRKRFNRDFWLPEMGFCPMGLDNNGHPLAVIASNPGHCLETGILSKSHAHRVAQRLMQADMFNGWGIRTLSSDMVAYNPMSYHNGSVWPHDNALIARGLRKVEHSQASERIFTGLFEAARLMQYKRLPELFCGFPRDSGTDPPVRYPVACSPQAWSAAAVFSLIQTSLNLKPDLANNRLFITQPRLPSWINQLTFRRLRLGSKVLDIQFRRSADSVVVDVLNRKGHLDILVQK